MESEVSGGLIDDASWTPAPECQLSLRRGWAGTEKWAPAEPRGGGQVDRLASIIIVTTANTPRPIIPRLIQRTDPGRELRLESELQS